MDCFIQKKSSTTATTSTSTSTSFTALCNRFIKVVTHTYPIESRVYTMHTYSVKIPKGKFEDSVYDENPELLAILPRACSIVMCEDTFVAIMEGPTKFSGRRGIDEDPEEGQDDTVTTTTIYDHSKIQAWADAEKLEIVDTQKANGKFAILKIVIHEGMPLILCGSKNYHKVLSFEQLCSIIEDKSENELFTSILVDIRINWSLYTSPQIMEQFGAGYSLVGELCDGQHFVSGDNTVSWFGFFTNGTAMETMRALHMLSSCYIKTVPYYIVFAKGTPSCELDAAFISARCTQTEGSVLRCRNTETEETVLVKSKSTYYIVLRFWRQILLKGYKEMEQLRTRFIDAQEYHGLNTAASIRITKQLFEFGFFMMRAMYPVGVLGHTKISSVRGELPNGFNTYWLRYLATGAPDIVISPEDFGSFDPIAYVENTPLYKIRSFAKPATIVFVQGIQGTGKSELANYIQDHIWESFGQIEQDLYWGCTLSAQGALYHMVRDANGPEIIVVSRCNVNPTHYKRYIDICLRLPCVITFATPCDLSPLYFAVAFSGIINRSTEGDRLMVGRVSLPLPEVFEFTRKNFIDFAPQSTTNTFKMFNYDVEAAEAISAFGPRFDNVSVDKMCEFFTKHWRRFHSLRMPINEVGDQIIEIIRLTQRRENLQIVLNPMPVYIGLAVPHSSQEHLSSIMELLHPTTESFTTYNHHCTQLFLGGKTKVPADTATSCIVKPGHLVTATIDALVVRVSDGACAFRISKLAYRDNIITMKNTPHITAKIPSHEKPAISNSFVGLTDDTVIVHTIDYDTVLIGFWA
jgi:hypothetical protein